MPTQVRSLLVSLASDALGGLTDQDTPRSLRPFRHFNPRRRRQHAAQSLLAETDTNSDFRTDVSEQLRRQSTAVTELLEETPAADSDEDAALDPAAVLARASDAGVDLTELAAAAYLLRPPGWERLASALAQQVGERRESSDLARYRRRIDEVQDRLDKAVAQHRESVARLREELATTRTETDRVRSALAEEKSRARRLERERDDLRSEIGRLTTQGNGHAAQAERQEATLQRQLAETVRQRDEARRLVRTGEAEADARLWLLLETAERAVANVRRELNVAVPESFPRDFVAAAHEPARSDARSGRRIADADVLGEVLGQPRAHLVVDGYNVTMAAYGGLALEDQRGRLAASLGALSARTGADVTCVFDGTERPPGVSVRAKGVYVLFSQGGQNADSLIGELVRAEPRGRVVVVASSDREVVEDSRRAGCYTVPSDVLAALVDRS